MGAMYQLLNAIIVICFIYVIAMLLKNAFMNSNSVRFSSLKQQQDALLLSPERYVNNK